VRDFKIQAGKYTVQRISERVTLNHGSLIENVTGDPVILALATRIDDLEQQNAQLTERPVLVKTLAQTASDRMHELMASQKCADCGNSVGGYRYCWWCGLPVPPLHNEPEGPA